MSGLELDELRLGPFQAFKTEQVYPLHLAYGLHYVRGENKLEPRLGSNGAGKSSLWDAMSWCLYGKTVRGLTNADVVPRGLKKASVTLSFHLRGKPVVVKRTANPNLTTWNGVELDNDTLVDRLGLSQLAFLNTIVIGQSRPLFMDLEPRDKMELLSEVLRLDRWDGYSDDASKLAQVRQRKLDDAEGEVKSILATLEAVRNTRVLALERADEWDTRRRDSVKDYTKALEKAEARLEVIDKTASTVGLHLEGSGLEARHAEEKLPAAVDKANEVRARLDTAKAHRAALYRQCDELERELKTKGDTCPTCGQELKDAKAIRAHKLSIREKLDQLDFDAKKAVPEKLVREWEQADGAVTALRKDVADFTKKEREAREAVTYAEREVERAKGEVDRAKRALKDAEDATNPHVQSARDLKKDIQAREQEHADAKDRVPGLAVQVQRAKYWVKAFKEIRLKLVGELLDELEQTANELAEEFGLVGWRVQFATEAETKSGTIKTGLITNIYKVGEEAPVKWKTFSGGEAQRLRLLVTLALSRVLLAHAGLRTDTIIMDEPTQHLSPEGVRDLLEMLPDIGRDHKQAFVLVDHTARATSLFETVTTIVKTSHGASIVPN